MYKVVFATVEHISELPTLGQIGVIASILIVAVGFVVLLHWDDFRDDRRSRKREKKAEERLNRMEERNEEFAEMEHHKFMERSCGFSDEKSEDRKNVPLIPSTRGRRVLSRLFT